MLSGKIPSGILYYDTETDSRDGEKANLKWFGAYSTTDNKSYEYTYKDISKIKILIRSHRHMVSFNGEGFDNLVLNRSGVNFKFKNIIDMLICSKQRLALIGMKPKNFKLKTIVDMLKISPMTKGEIDYDIFKKDAWNKEESKEIIKYLRCDVMLLKLLFEWMYEQFESLGELLNEHDREKLMHIKASPASLSTRIICNLAGIKNEFRTKEECDALPKGSYMGGHHILNRESMYKGNIVSVDVSSAYPHAIIQGNLCSYALTGWDGGDYYNLKGKYNNQKQGNVETALHKILLMKIEAKKNGDKIKNKSYKLVSNSFYGTFGCKCFKTFYDIIKAGDCTSMVRTWLKKLAKNLEIEGFKVIGGYTDNVMVLIPNESSKEELLDVVNDFVEEVKQSLPFPKETFKIELEEEIKFIWFLVKNCYLWVDKDDNVKYKRTLFDKNTPEIIMDVFNNFMSPRIIKELDINFTKEELIEQIRLKLKGRLELAGIEYNIKDTKEYESKTSIQYQISKVYGEGQHLMIPNIRGKGIGKAKSTRKKIGVRYCTKEDFIKHKLRDEDIDLSKLMDHLKPFINKPEKEKEIQLELSQQLEGGEIL